MDVNGKLAQAIAAVLSDDHGGGSLGIVVPDNLDQVEIAAGSGGMQHLCGTIRTMIAEAWGEDRVFARRAETQFVVLMPDCPPARAGARMAALLDRIPGCRVASGGDSFGVTARGAVIAAGLVQPRTAERALQLLEAAAWITRNGQDALVVLGPGDAARLTEVELGARLLAGLPMAMGENRVLLYAQQIVALRDMAPARYECEVLVQILDGRGLAHSPGALIRKAENSHLIELLDRWVIHAAIVGHADLLHRAPHVDLSLNLSGRTLGHPQLWDYLAGVITASGLSPKRFQFEITETSAIYDMAAAQANVRAARAAGCRVALDDFGAGLSGLAYLKSFELDAIKIDGDLIPHVGDPTRIESEIVPAVIGLGTRLGLEVVTEHVAHRDALDVLRRLEVAKVQGFLFGQPRPLRDVLEEQAAAAGPRQRREDMAGTELAEHLHDGD